MTAKVGNTAFDCKDVLSMARFWSAVLGLPLGDGSSAEFATFSGTDADRGEPAWYFNKVSETKRATNRVHLDVTDPNPSAGEELVALGASMVTGHRMGSHEWDGMQEFCIAARL